MITSIRDGLSTNLIIVKVGLQFDLSILVYCQELYRIVLEVVLVTSIASYSTVICVCYLVVLPFLVPSMRTPLNYV